MVSDLLSKWFYKFTKLKSRFCKKVKVYLVSCTVHPCGKGDRFRKLCSKSAGKQFVQTCCFVLISHKRIKFLSDELASKCSRFIAWCFISEYCSCCFFVFFIHINNSWFRRKCYFLFVSYFYWLEDQPIQDIYRMHATKKMNEFWIVSFNIFNTVS